MPFVIDASVTVCWAFSEETDASATAARERLASESAVAPSLWWFEVRNALIVNERRKRLQEDFCAAFLRLLVAMPILIDRAPDEADLMALARRHRLTVYGAAYLELARRRREPLATLDKKLAAAAKAESVALFAAP
jgi:predicted nucleic acid-binding protein